MRFNIVWRLGIALGLVGVLAAGLTGYYGYSESRILLTTAAEERLLTATRVLARQLSLGLNSAARDVRLVAGHPGTRKLLTETNPAALSAGNETLALLFESMLRTHREYFQMRLIAATDDGLERVRVDRTDNGVVRVDGRGLQEKGQYPYVFGTLRLSDGAVYVSRASLNQEVDAHAGHRKPSLQVATPVHAPDGRALGLVVLDIDLDGLFAQLAVDLPPGLRLYLTNSEGDFLIHPDPKQAFAFTHGQRALVQDRFPDAATLLTSAAQRKDQVVTAVAKGPRKDALMAAFVRHPLTGLHSEEDFILGIGQPLNEVLADSDRLGAESLRIVLGFSALALLLAALLARALSRPLKEMINVVQQFGDGAANMPLPSHRTDEIGMLARSIEQMQQQIRAQFRTLQQKQQELDRLASHDSLTGLPNRRLFLDRLDQAMARARRNQGQLALLFIDLDNFKEINDNLGHAAGDAVLCEVGQRLADLVREIDTVARLGGDEYIILLDGADDLGAIEHVAQCALEALAQPVIYGNATLAFGSSIGISRYPQDASDMTELIAAADKAMYRAKQSGRNRICFARARAN